MRGRVGVAVLVAYLASGCVPASVFHSPQYPYVGCHRHVSGRGNERIVIHGESPNDATELLVSFIDSNMPEVIVNIAKDTVLPRSRCESQWMNFGADSAGRVQVP